MAASFYASPLIGATTTLACFAHEIPHEIADYSILIRSGFTKKQAMQSQFLTAIGAFVSSRSLRLCFSRLLDCARRRGGDLKLTSFPAKIGRVSHGYASYLEQTHSKIIRCSTFIGIAVHTATASDSESPFADLAAGVRQDATGLLGTTLQLSDLVGCAESRACTVLTRAVYR